MATAKGKPRIIDVDRGWKDIQREIRKTQGKPHVVVGIYGASADAPHTDSGFSVGRVASVHECGLGVPERSFIRATVDAWGPQIARLARAQGKKVLTGTAAVGRDVKGKFTSAGGKRKPYPMRKALDVIGAFVHGKIIERINEGISPENRPSTIAKKGSSKPLIDTGQLKGSIAWEVRNA